MNGNENERMKLTIDFLNTAISIQNCMRNKCKIINDKINNNPIYKKNISKLILAKNDKEIIKIIDEIMNIADYPNYNECQHKNCNKNLKKLVIILLKLYNYYKTKENKKFPKTITNAILKLTSAIDNKEKIFINYDRETNILLSYIRLI